MRLSQTFTKTTKSAPADEQANNAKLLIQAGFIHKEMAGVYAFLPLGLKVIENIKQIVREEMNNIGGSELIMTNLQRQELWEKTNRWDDEVVDIWFKTELKNGSKVGLAWSHEEPITDMMKNYISSYRDLPVNVYQFQNKLRNELRAKSGIMRGREFIMKDLYSYSRNNEEHDKIYNEVTEAYKRVFDRVGLGDITYVTSASGGVFTTKYSHEFQTITEAGEDTIYVDKAKNIAINEEVYNDETIAKLDLNKDNLEKTTSAEIANIFSFGTVTSEQLGLTFTDEDGQEKPVVLGSYGIGITRLMGVIAEHFSDDKGLVWPISVAPAIVYLASVGQSEAVKNQADKLYDDLLESGISVIYDDRDTRPGQKFADAELMGIPYRVVVSDKTLESNSFELKSRTSDDTKLVSQEELVKTLENKS
jgi:prolyl-tRNA synthetase